MSKYSGKCDFYDNLCIHEYTEEELKNNIIIYIGNSKNPLKIDSYKSLIPYYPHIISVGSFDNEKRKSTIYLTSKSWVDIEEEESLNFYLSQILRVYNRCKRKKVPFDLDMARKELGYLYNDIKEVIDELIDRVNKYGKKANIDGLHLPFKEQCYRKILIDEMLRNGLDPCEYGYERFVNNGGGKINESATR